ncbi:MAG: hypothetical protein ABMA64_39450 [Myxococcota bacterium]
MSLRLLMVFQAHAQEVTTEAVVTKPAIDVIRAELTALGRGCGFTMLAEKELARLNKQIAAQDPAAQSKRDQDIAAAAAKFASSFDHANFVDRTASSSLGPPVVAFRTVGTIELPVPTGRPVYALVPLSDGHPYYVARRDCASTLTAYANSDVGFGVPVAQANAAAAINRVANTHTQIDFAVGRFESVYAKMLDVVRSERALQSSSDYAVPLALWDGLVRGDVHVGDTALDRFDGVVWIRDSEATAETNIQGLSSTQAGATLGVVSTSIEAAIQAQLASSTGSTTREIVSHVFTDSRVATAIPTDVQIHASWLAGGKGRTTLDLAKITQFGPTVVEVVVGPVWTPEGATLSASEFSVVLPSGSPFAKGDVVGEPALTADAHARLKIALSPTAEVGAALRLGKVRTTAFVVRYGKPLGGLALERTYELTAEDAPTAYVHSVDAASLVPHTKGPYRWDSVVQVRGESRSVTSLDKLVAKCVDDGDSEVSPNVLFTLGSTTIDDARASTPVAFEIVSAKRLAACTISGEAMLSGMKLASRFDTRVTFASADSAVLYVEPSDLPEDLRGLGDLDGGRVRLDVDAISDDAVDRIRDHAASERKQRADRD